MTTDFYRAFEDRFRGSRELIQSRLTVYLPFIRPLKEIYPQPRGVDLGCGRGEWLEMLVHNGFDAIGVDLDEGMLNACKELGLNTRKEDAIGFLGSLPDASISVVSAFHLVEHLPFEALQQLVQQALRVLVPGGLLIMETPNPENLQVGAHTFYYDPTHQHPIPPLLLAFVPEHTGFGRTKILRLQQDPLLQTAEAPSLMDVLTGPSPDYAVVAQKQSEEQGVLGGFDQAFFSDYGLTLNTMAARFDASRTHQLEIVRQECQRALASASKATTIAEEARKEAAQIRELIVGFENTIQHYQSLIPSAEPRVNDLQESTSWRITSPLRWLSTALRKLVRTPLSVVRFSARLILLTAMRFVLKHSKLRQLISSRLKRFPHIAHRLHLMAIHRGAMPPPKNSPTTTSHPAPPPVPEHPLPAHAKRIHNELKLAVSRSNKT